MSTSATSFNPPEFWSFKPFFTLQPVLATREKQLNCWCSIVLQYCTHHNVSQLELQTFQLFQNDAIGRKLSPDGVRAVASRLISTGNGEWEDTSQTRLRIILKSPESLAVDVYNWAKRNDFIGTVFTVYELHSGEDHSDSGFYGTESVDLVRALRILERDGKAAIMRGSIPDEDGVKFLADR